MDAESPVIIVDDDRNQVDLLVRLLGLEGLDARGVHGPEEALRLLNAAETAPVVVSDYNMPGMTGLDLFREARRRHPHLPFLIMTAYGTLETAVEAMRAGVHDFVTKPVDAGELAVKIRRARRVHVLEEENRDLRSTVESLQGRVQIIGESAVMRRVLERVHQVAPSQATVLIRGESGTGKELIAKAIHLNSHRAQGPYIKVNCAAIPENLLESELFGHRKGAFTGAVADRVGRFETAHGGTLLLDEIGDLPLSLQPKLLRVLQEREIEPVGATASKKVDVRLIAATHQDLQAMVRQGEFREDLFYRLNVIPIDIPPLRDRGTDIIALARHFLAKFGEENGRRMQGFGRRAEERLLTWSWPGNVRELENCVERAVVLCSSDVIREADLILDSQGETGTQEDVENVVDTIFDGALTLDDLERRIITMALERCGGNLSRTARTLGLTRRALQYRVEKMKGTDGEDGGTTGDDPEEDRE